MFIMRRHSNGILRIYYIYLHYIFKSVYHSFSANLDRCSAQSALTIMQ